MSGCAKVTARPQDLLSVNSRALSDTASGRPRIATDRGGQTILRMRGRQSVNAAWKVPTTLTDASLQIVLVRHLWPDMKLIGDIAVEAKHQHIRQIIDRSYALSSLDANVDGHGMRPP